MYCLSLATRSLYSIINQTIKTRGPERYQHLPICKLTWPTTVCIYTQQDSRPTTMSINQTCLSYSGSEFSESEGKRGIFFANFGRK
ncbi:hypothetical protein DPMN_062741 [Dreissena polymorpha]|uniref:Uncharacterized protein n=1 Tax=Dreissena polymorpha TaxID=45954 RepID=A0A9D4C9Z4_DREPO|nr:hypothetical protein DPMN_062741 [Dreissena polymorpha]